MITIKRRGFSLVELMIVIAIMGILLTMALPSWHRYRLNADLKSAAREIAGDIFTLKQRAVGEQSPYRIIFDLGNHSYQLINVSTGNVVRTRNLTEFGYGITMTGSTFNNDTINFSTRGTVAPGSITLSNTRNSTATVTVNITGRTHVSFNMQ